MGNKKLSVPRDHIQWLREGKTDKDKYVQGVYGKFFF
jgi:hypothetical protein